MAVTSSGKRSCRYRNEARRLYAGGPTWERAAMIPVSSRSSLTAASW